MIELATIAQAVSVFAACWAIIAGIGAWKREFVGKRQIELAEQALAKFFEIRDAVAHIRNPFLHNSEGSTRQRGPNETPDETDILNRGYIVIERYTKRESVFAEFNTLKYRFMASFGPETEEIFLETNRTVHSIFSSARILATHYWKRQGRVPMEGEEFQKHLDRMHKHEGILWETGDDDDEVRKRLAAVQSKLETAVAPCFQRANWHIHAAYKALAVTPNPSLKRSANGRPPDPRGAVVYLAPRGPGVLPLSSA